MGASISNSNRRKETNMSHDKCSNLRINEVWPVNTSLIKNGGIGVYWSGDIGFGEFVLKWGDDGKLHANTEFLDHGDDKRFTEAILKLLVSEIVIDE